MSPVTSRGVSAANCVAAMLRPAFHPGRVRPARKYSSRFFDAWPLFLNAIADEVMQKLGGRKNWDNTRYITWKFFGRRFHVWDKRSGDIRVESGNRTVLMNINTKEGRVWEDGTEVTHPDSLAKRLDRGYRAWINDSYWLVMPYKLKDSGDTLKYVVERETERGAN